jgi:hypothetical protein
MTAPNHALTGAAIGLAVANPWVAIPLAFLSHFALDAIPHYDVPGGSNADRIGSRHMFYIQIVGGALLCFAIVLGLFFANPENWLLAAFCAFIATSPDLLSFPRYLSVKKNGVDPLGQWWFWRIHHNIQWKVGERFWAVEVLWAGAMLTLLSTTLFGS